MRRLCSWWSSFDEDGQRVLPVVFACVAFAGWGCFGAGVCLVDVWVGGTGW